MMISLRITQLVRRLFFLALPLAIALLLLFPGISQAHAILIKSDPARDAVLKAAPSQVRMWFSEDLNPATSSATVVNSANQRVDVGKSLVLPSDAREMDISLQPNLPPSVYVVIWHTQSAADGHVLSGSFLFSVAGPDGTVPKTNGPLPDQNIANAANAGTLDGPTLFSFLMITLADLGAVFWVGAQLWRSFVMELSESNEQQLNLEQRAEARFVRHFSLPILRITFLANIGVLLGQALAVTNGNWSQIFAPALLSGLITNGHFGTFWLTRIVVIVLAMVIGSYMTLTSKRPKLIDEILPWANLILGLALLIALTLSGHAAAVSGNVAIYAILIDWLHLLAASLWIGGMMYLSAIYLPAIQGSPLIERTRSLLTILPRFSPLAIVGVIIMAISGPFNATVHMTSWDQLITTAYGRTLLIKVALVGGMLLVSAIHVGFLRPRLARDYKKYQSLLAKGQMEAIPETRKASELELSEIEEFSEAEEIEQASDQDPLEKGQIESQSLINRQAQRWKGKVAEQMGQLSKVLRWEPAIGIAVIVCTGLLNVFAGTLQPIAPPTPVQPPVVQTTVTPARPFDKTFQTDDKKFTIKLNISPNRFGPNVFTVTVLDSKGSPDTSVGVSLYTTMLDMDMGTESINLQPDGKGNFTASGDLGMPGNWKIRVQIRTPETLSGANVTFIASY